MRIRLIMRQNASEISSPILDYPIVSGKPERKWKNEQLTVGSSSHRFRSPAAELSRAINFSDQWGDTI